MKIKQLYRKQIKKMVTKTRQNHTLWEGGEGVVARYLKFSKRESDREADAKENKTKTNKITNKQKKKTPRPSTTIPCVITCSNLPQLIICFRYRQTYYRRSVGRLRFSHHCHDFLHIINNSFEPDLPHFKACLRSSNYTTVFGICQKMKIETLSTRTANNQPSTESTPQASCIFCKVYT